MVIISFFFIFYFFYFFIYKKFFLWKKERKTMYCSKCHEQIHKEMVGLYFIGKDLVCITCYMENSPKRESMPIACAKCQGIFPYPLEKLNDEKYCCRCYRDLRIKRGARPCQYDGCLDFTTYCSSRYCSSHGGVQPF